MIHQLREQGGSITEIARRTGLDRKTVRRYLAEDWNARSTARGRRARG